MSLRIFFVLLLVCGLCPITATTSAQRQLKGKVFTPESKEEISSPEGGAKEVYIPLPGASVMWKGSGLGTMTDIHGFFKLAVKEIGDTLQVSMVGYETMGVIYTGQNYLEIPMSQGVFLESVEVETRRSTSEISLLDPLNVQTLNRKELAKAACCNLSEAFETNASVDVSFTDAVTGTRQIRMLGLDGKYTQILVDNMPGPRGLNVVQGLAFIPGPWIDRISISKGTGSVVSGYESITGQINVALRNPENAEPLHINLYKSGDGRVEWNHVSRHQIGRRWSTSLLTHYENGSRKNDRNVDGFLDTPLKRDFVLRNEWKYRGDRGVRGEYSVSAVSLDRLGGKTIAFDGIDSPWDNFEDFLSGDNPNFFWYAATTLSRVEATAKTGYVFPGQAWKSIGTQFLGSTHTQGHRFGNRSYSGSEKFFRGNMLFSSIIGTTDHKFTTGVSYLYDNFKEIGSWSATSNDWSDTKDTLSRVESVPGVFFEYTFKANDRLVVVAGLRQDYHNLYGTFASPRLHVRWSIAEETALKLVAGKGFRTANVFMEQLGAWASNRQWILPEQGLEPEVATNIGLNLVSKFRLNSRDATISLDGYWTEFENRVVVDFYSESNQINIFNLGDRHSRSQTLQMEFDWSMHRRVDVRAAYRWVNATTDYLTTDIGFMRRDPYVAKHRAFTQWSYASREGKRGEQTRVDATLQWIGGKALPQPNLTVSDIAFHPELSPALTQLNLQVSQTFNGAFEIYVGVENLTNVKQKSPIVSALYPDEFNENFDASLIYGPIFGRMTYAGLRWTVGKAKKD